MRVNVDEKALSEPRIKRMAKRLSAAKGREINHFEVLGRLVHVWMLSYQRRSSVVDALDVDIVADMDGFAEAMMADEMAHRDDGGVYICGVSERIQFLGEQAERGKAGAKARARNIAKENERQRSLFPHLANAQANAKTSASERTTKRQNDPQAYSPDLDLDLAPDLAPDHVTRPAADEPQAASGAEHGEPKGGGRKRAPERANAQDEGARELPDEAFTMAALLLALIKANNPNSRQARQSEPEQRKAIARWAVPIERLHRLDRYTWGEIEGMIRWCQRDPFWRQNILGGDSLRDQWDKLAAKRQAQGGPPARAAQASPTRLAMEETARLEREEREARAAQESPP